MIYSKKLALIIMLATVISACATDGSKEGELNVNKTVKTEVVDPFSVSVLSIDESKLAVLSGETDKEDIKNIQIGLKKLGYAIRSVDSIAGDETRSVIERFQRDFELPIDGEASLKLLAQLSFLNSSKEPGTIIGNVIEIQELLIKKDLLKTKVDGVPGAATRKAISEYQLNQGLTVDGELTKGLLEKLQSQ